MIQLKLFSIFFCSHINLLFNNANDNLALRIEPSFLRHVALGCYYFVKIHLKNCLTMKYTL
jgi:hypothetical protein